MQYPAPAVRAVAEIHVRVRQVVFPHDAHRWNASRVPVSDLACSAIFFFPVFILHQISLPRQEEIAYRGNDEQPGRPPREMNDMRTRSRRGAPAI